jgi:hypothetical protein
MAAEEHAGGDRAVSAAAEAQKDAFEAKMFYRLKIDVEGC